MIIRNTRLESEGAEFLVLGQLLLRGIPAYKTCTNMAGYEPFGANRSEELAPHWRYRVLEKSLRHGLRGQYAKPGLLYVSGVNRQEICPARRVPEVSPLESP